MDRGEIWGIEELFKIWGSEEDVGLCHVARETELGQPPYLFWGTKSRAYIITLGVNKTIGAE